MNNDFYLKNINITIPDNQYQIINMNKIETAMTNIKFDEILKILEFKNQEIKLNSYFEMIINKDTYKKTGTRNHNFNLCKICKCYINDIFFIL